MAPSLRRRTRSVHATTTSSSRDKTLSKKPCSSEDGGVGSSVIVLDATEQHKDPTNEASDLIGKQEAIIEIMSEVKVTKATTSLPEKALIHESEQSSTASLPLQMDDPCHEDDAFSKSPIESGSKAPCHLLNQRSAQDEVDYGTSDEEDEDDFFRKPTPNMLRRNVKRGLPENREELSPVDHAKSSLGDSEAKRRRSSSPHPVESKVKEMEVAKTESNLVPDQEDASLEDQDDPVGSLEAQKSEEEDGVTDCTLIPSRTPSPQPSVSDTLPHPSSPSLPKNKKQSKIGKALEKSPGLEDQIICIEDDEPMDTSDTELTRLEDRESSEEPLDPDLAAIVNATQRRHQSSPSSSPMPRDGRSGMINLVGEGVQEAQEKITVVCHPRIHSKFSLPSSVVLGREAYEKPITFLAFTSMTFSQIALTFSQYRGVDPGSIIFTYKGTRLYEVGSPQSLGWKDKVSLDVHFKEAWQWMEKSRDEAFRRQLEEDEEGDLEEDGEMGATETGITKSSEPQVVHLQLTLRGREGEGGVIRVKPTTLIASIAREYRSMTHLPEDRALRLEFDGVILNQGPGSTVGDTDLEDGDMISVFLPVA